MTSTIILFLITSIVCLTPAISSDLTPGDDLQTAALSGDTHALSLDDCIREVLDNNVDLRAVIDGLKISQEKITELNRRLWPSLSMMVIDNSGLGHAGSFSQYDPVTGESYIPGEGFQASANLQWSLYDGSSRRSAVRIEQETLTLRSLNLRETRRDLIRQVVTQYLSILELQAEKDVRIEQLTQAEEALKIATARLDSGSGIAYEVLLEEAYLAQAEADLFATDSAMNQALRALLVSMRRNVSQPVKLAPLELSATDDSFDSAALMAIAVSNRLEFLQYQSEINTWKMQLKMLQSSRKPKIDFTLAYSQQGQDFQSFQDGDISWSAGLSLSFSPFSDTSLTGSTQRNWINSTEFMQMSSFGIILNDGSSIKSRETEIKITILKLERELDYLKDIVTSEVLAAWEALRSSESVWLARRKNLEAMEENERIQEKRFELGLNQYKDIVDARTDRVSARIALTRAEYSMEHDRTDLRYVLGLLDSEE
ncbi:TolC family protein [bacterium]|nr:TolC family protein [candidate division CSSED10-310 bacterium]